MYGYLSMLKKRTKKKKENTWLLTHVMNTGKEHQQRDRSDTPIQGGTRPRGNVKALRLEQEFDWTVTFPSEGLEGEREKPGVVPWEGDGTRVFDS